jgi:hypothetical protein
VTEKKLLSPSHTFDTEFVNKSHKYRLKLYLFQVVTSATLINIDTLLSVLKPPLHRRWVVRPTFASKRTSRYNEKVSRLKKCDKFFTCSEIEIKVFVKTKGD